MGGFTFKSTGLLLVISFLAQGSHGWIRFRYPYSRRVFLQQTSLERLQDCAEQPEETCGLCGEGPGELPTTTISDENYITPEVTDNVLDVQLAFRADLLGSFEFRLCEVGQDVLTSGRTCRNIPTLELFGDRRSYSPSSRQSSATVPVTIPPGTVCEKCVLQVRYIPGRDPDGLGNHTYYDCAPVTFTATPILTLLRSTAETTAPTDQFTSTLISGSQNSGASSIQGNNVNSDNDQRVASLVLLGQAGDQSVARLVIGNEAKQVGEGRLSGGVRELGSSQAPASANVENTAAQGFAETVVVRNNISSRTGKTTSEDQSQGQSGKAGATTNIASISSNDAASASMQTVDRGRDGLSGVSFIGGSRVGGLQGSNAADGRNVLTNTITRTYIIEPQAPRNSDVRVTSDNIVSAGQGVNTLSGGLFGGLNVNAGNEQQVDSTVNYVVNGNGNTLRTGAFGASETSVSSDSFRSMLNDKTERTVVRNNNILTSSASNNVVGNLQNGIGNTVAADNMLSVGSFRGTGIDNNMATRTVPVNTADNRMAGNSLNTDVVDNTFTRNGNTLVNERGVSGRVFGAGMVGVMTNNLDSTRNQGNNLVSSVVYSDTGLGDGRPDNVIVGNTIASRGLVDAAGRTVVGERTASRGDLATDAVVLDNTMNGNAGITVTRGNEISGGTVIVNTGTGMGGRLNTAVDDATVARNPIDSRTVVGERTVSGNIMSTEAVGNTLSGVADRAVILENRLSSGTVTVNSDNLMGGSVNSVDNAFVSNGGASGVNRVTVERTATGSAFGTGVVENALSGEPGITVIRRNSEAGRAVTVNSGDDVSAGTPQQTVSGSAIGNRLVGTNAIGVDGNAPTRSDLDTIRTLAVNTANRKVDGRFNNIAGNAAASGPFNTNGNRRTGDFEIGSGGIGTRLNGNTMPDDSTLNGQNIANPNSRFLDSSLNTIGADSTMNSNSLSANGNVIAREDRTSGGRFRPTLTGNTVTRITEASSLNNDFPRTDGGRMTDRSLNNNVRTNNNILGFDRTAPSGVLGLGDRSSIVDSSTIIRGNISSGTLTVNKDTGVAGGSGMIAGTTDGRSATISKAANVEGATTLNEIGIDGRNNAMGGQTDTRAVERTFVTGTVGSDDISNVLGGQTGVAERTLVTGTIGLDNRNRIITDRTGTRDADRTILSGTLRPGDNNSFMTDRTGTTSNERTVVTGTVITDDIAISGQTGTTRDAQESGRNTIITNNIRGGITTLTDAVGSIDNVGTGQPGITFVRASDVPKRTDTTQTADANNIITDQTYAIADGTLLTDLNRVGDTSNMITGQIGTRFVQGNDISRRTITIDANRNAIDGSFNTMTAVNIPESSLFTDGNTVADRITSNVPADGTRGTNIQGGRVSSGTLTINVDDRLAAGPVDNNFIGSTLTGSSFSRNSFVGEMGVSGSRINGDGVIGTTMTGDSGRAVTKDTSGVVGIGASGRNVDNAFSTSPIGMFGSTQFDVSASSLDRNLGENTLGSNFVRPSTFDSTLSSNLVSANGDLPVDDTRINFDRNTLDSGIAGVDEASRRIVGDFSTNFVNDRVIDRSATRTSVSTGANNVLVDPSSKMLMVALSGGRTNGENVISDKTLARNEEQFMANGVLSTSNNIAGVSSIDSVFSKDVHTNDNTFIYNASENSSGSTVSKQAELFMNDSKAPVESLVNDTLISSDIYRSEAVGSYFDRPIQNDSSLYDNRMTLDKNAGKVVVDGRLTDPIVAGIMDINNVNDAYFDQTTSATNTETYQAKNAIGDTNVANRGINTRDWRYHDSLWYGFGDEASTTTASSVIDESYIQNNSRPVYDTVAVDTVQATRNLTHTGTSGQGLQHQEIVSVPNTITVFPLNTPIPLTTGRSKQGDIIQDIGAFQNIPTTQRSVARSETTTANPRNFQSLTDIPTQTTGIPFPADSIATTTQSPITDRRWETFPQETTQAYDYASSPNTQNPFIYDRYDGTSTQDWRYIDTSATRQDWTNSQTNGQRVVGLDIGTAVNDRGFAQNIVSSRDRTQVGTSGVIYENNLTNVRDLVNYQLPVDTNNVINAQSGSIFSDSRRNVDPIGVPSTDSSRIGFYDVTTQGPNAGFNRVSTATTRPINMATNKETQSIVYNGATVVRDYPNIVSGGLIATVKDKTDNDVISDVRSKVVDTQNMPFDRNSKTKQNTESIRTIVSEPSTLMVEKSSPQPRISVNEIPTLTITESPKIIHNDIMPTTVRDPQILYDSPSTEIPFQAGVDQSVSVSVDSTALAAVNTVQISEANYTLIDSGITNIGKTTSSKTQDVSFMDLVGNVDSFGGVPIDNGKTSGSGSFFILSKPASSQSINSMSDGKSFDVTNSLSSDNTISDTVRTGFVVYNFSDIVSPGGSFDSSVVPVQDMSGGSFSGNQVLADIQRNGDSGVNIIRANTDSGTSVAVADTSMAPITMPPILTTENVPETPIVSRAGVTNMPIAGTGVQYDVNTGTAFGTALQDNVNSIKTMHTPVGTSTVWKGLGIIRNTPVDGRGSDKATPVDVNDQFTYHYFKLMQGSKTKQQSGSGTEFEKVPEVVNNQNTFDPYLTTSPDAQQGSVNVRDGVVIRSDLDRTIRGENNLRFSDEVLLSKDGNINKTDISNKNVSSSTLWDLNRRNKDTASVATSMDTSGSVATNMDTSGSVATNIDTSGSVATSMNTFGSVATSMGTSGSVASSIGTVKYDASQDFPMEWTPITGAGLDAQFLDQLAPNNMPPIIVKFADGTPDRKTQDVLQSALRTVSQSTLQTGSQNINDNKDDVTIRILQTLEELITELKKKDPTASEKSFTTTLVADRTSAAGLRRDIGVNMRDVTRDTGFNTAERLNTVFDKAVQQNTGFDKAVQQNTGFDNVERQNAGFNMVVQQNTGFDTMVQQNTGFDNVARQDIGIKMVARKDTGANTNVRTSAIQGSAQSNLATDNMFYFTDPVNMDVPPPIFPGDSTAGFTGLNEIGTIKLSNLEGVTGQRQWSPGIGSNQINIDKVDGAARQRLNISDSRFQQPLIRLPNQKGSMYQILMGKFANVSATKRKAIEKMIANKMKEGVINTLTDATTDTVNIAREFNTANPTTDFDSANRAREFAVTDAERASNASNPVREFDTATAAREFVVASSELPLSNETKINQIRQQRVIHFTDGQIRNPFAGTNIPLQNMTDKLGNIMATEPQYRASSDFATLNQAPSDFATLGQINTAESGAQANSDRNLISIEGKYYIGEMRRNANGQFEPVPVGADILRNAGDVMQFPSQSGTRATNTLENNVVMPGTKRPTVYINLPTEVGSDIQGNQDFINQNSLLEIIKRQQDVTNVGVDSNRVLGRTHTPADRNVKTESNRVFVTLPASNARTESNRVLEQPETLMNSFAPSPGPKAVVCREDERFVCSGVGSYQNIPGMVWWCFSHCKNGVCPLEKCDCSCEVSGRSFMSVETPQIITRPIVVPDTTSTDNSRVRKVINLTLNGSKESLIRVGEGFSRTSEKILQPDTQRDSGSQSQRLDAGSTFRMDSTQGGTTDRRRALLFCRGINAFADTAGMDRWCTTMCRRNVCPSEICACNV